MRKFNTTGNCMPDRHYMIDISNKINKISRMVDEEQYFTINRARQYGKTTTLDLLEIRLIESGYTVAYLSFEGLSNNYFADPGSFCRMFMEKMRDYLHDDTWYDENVDDFKPLGDHIGKMCGLKKIVLFIDEVDITSNNLIFLYFLGMLRNKYLKRNKYPTFHSVILTGVTDIKNIKYRMVEKGMTVLGNNEGSHNSPWNIAADFDVDMSFSPEEIATMLRQYEEDHCTGMDIMAISEEIYRYTSGYPYMVSRLCQHIEEKLERDWTMQGIQEAVKILLAEKNTLFDDMSKNLENYPELYNFIYEIIIVGNGKSYQIDNPVIHFGVMFGYLKDCDGRVAISNRIFELRMSNYFISKDETSGVKKRLIPIQSDIIRNNIFDMQLCLEKFAAHFKEIYNPAEDAEFLERHCRMLFLSYLKPLINGRGFYHMESQLDDYRRMDIVVDYGKKQFIVELKRWYGDGAHTKAYDQLLGYMEARGACEGYLLTFNFSKNPKFYEPKWIEINGRRIFDIIV